MKVQPNDAALGIDVSNHNGIIDWQQVASTGVTFAFAKATEGTTYHDPLFATNYAGMKAADIIRGAYCFARPATSSAIDEANAFVDVVLAAGGFDELPPILDLEDSGGLSPAELSQFVLDWMSIVKTRTGHDGILYASPAFIREHLDNSVAGIRLWVANYGVSQPEDAPPFVDWDFWQYTSSGSISGINGYVDLNYYSGTLDDLRARFVPQSKPVPRQGGEDVLVPTLQQNVQGHTEAVRALQGAVGATPDGDFGPLTKDAVQRFQRAHGLTDDGVVGPLTWGKILA